MKHILVGISLSEQSPKVLKFALKLAQFFECTLTVAYIVQDKHLDELSNYALRENKANAIEEFRLEKEKRLLDFISNQHGKQHQNAIHTIVQYGDVYEQLQKIAQEQKADLMLVGKLTKSGIYFPSFDIANQLIEWSPCPVFIVPEDAEFQTFERILYVSHLSLEDCAAILKLKEWTEAFHAELICLHVYGKKSEEALAQTKLDILRQLFPQEHIRFRMIEANIATAIDRYTTLSKSQMIATTHRHRTIWEDIFKSSLTKSIASDVSVPLLVFQQQ